MAANLFGAPSENVVATSTTVSTVLAGNVNRCNGMIINKDASIGIQISLTDETANTKFFVLAAGGVFSLAGYQGPVYAKAVSGTPSLYVLELVG